MRTTLFETAHSWLQGGRPTESTRPRRDRRPHMLLVPALLAVTLVAPVAGPASAQESGNRVGSDSSEAARAVAGTPYPLANPGFEGDYLSQSECLNITGDVASGWTDNTCWDTLAPKVRYERDSAAPHSGAAAQKITLESGARAQFAQYLGAPLQPGAKYTVSFWVRADSPIFVTSYLRDSGPPYTGYAGKTAKLNTTWTQYSFESFVEQPTISLFFTASTPGSFSVDDVSITSTPSTAPSLKPPTRAVPRSYFGVHLNYLETPWPSVSGRVGSVRMWDTDRRSDGTGTGSQWADVNTTAGSYDWSGLDARVATARSNRADIVYTLGGRTPQWASGQPNAFSPYGPGQCAQPATMATWETWVRDVATRYKGKITLWELWNEPDLTDFYCGTPDQLIELASRASTILREVDPKNRVLSPGFSGFAGPSYLDYFLRNGGLPTFDILSYHFYAQTPELNLGTRLQNLRAVISGAGAGNKPLWNTEQGWIDLVATPVSQSTGAAYIGRAYLLNWSAGAGRFYYYFWDNNSFLPLIEDDGTTLTESGVAYREVAGWMIGRVVTSVTTDASGTYTLTLRAPSGATSHVLWNPVSTVQAVIPSSWKATERLDLAGGRTSVAGAATIEVGESPVLLR
ncbi:carbohydrate binding domain-containing protein [Salinibacterium sp.]|uniref:carbohydrate binding domain-containing protein n=1 Tax=Salinibacterium sp. TaxID=1915057 RepID=UPI00286D6560|nr:carbohydrate binding domain-containing protein [Salinibacterium sp.]